MMASFDLDLDLAEIRARMRGDIDEMVLAPQLPSDGVVGGADLLIGDGEQAPARGLRHLLKFGLDLHVHEAEIQGHPVNDRPGFLDVFQGVIEGEPAGGVPAVRQKDDGVAPRTPLEVVQRKYDGVVQRGGSARGDGAEGGEKKFLARGERHQQARRGVEIHQKGGVPRGELVGDEFLHRLFDDEQGFVHAVG